MNLARVATTTTIATNTSYTNNQLQAARDVNRIEYEQRVQALDSELVQVQLQRQQAGLQAQQQLQQNERSYTQGMYEVLKQRVAAQEQAYAGKEQGMQIQAETANQGTSQYRELLNAAFQLEAQQQQEQQKAAQASMFVDPLGVTNTANLSSNLQSQVESFMQNRMMNNQAIGDDKLQTEYATALSEVLRRLGINDSQLTSNMADQNQSNIQTQRNQNQSQINQQQALNNQAFSQAEQGLRDARSQEGVRYQSDDKNLIRLNNAQQQAQQRNNMSLSGYTYQNGAWYQNNQSPTMPDLNAQGYSGGGNGGFNTNFQQNSFNTNFGGTSQPQQANKNLYLGNGSSAKETLLAQDPKNVIIMPEDVKPSKSNIKTQPANTSKPPESAKGKKK